MGMLHPIDGSQSPVRMLPAARISSPRTKTHTAADFPAPKLAVIAVAALCLGAYCQWQLRINNPPGRSTLVIRTVTTGTQIDRDGYTVTVTGSGLPRPDSRHFRPNGAETYHFNGVDGKSVVELKDLAENCSISGRNPRAVDIIPGGKSETTFEIACLASVP